MKEFNLKEAKAGKPICTKDGHPVRIICYNKANNDGLPIVALIERTDGEEIVALYSTNGRYYDGNEECDYDLAMVTEKKSGWMNIYREGGCSLWGRIYPTREDALEAKKGNTTYVATTEIEWEE